MIFIATENKDVVKQISEELKASELTFKVIDITQPTYFSEFYRAEVTALIVDYDLPGMPRGAAIDIFNSLARRVPIIVLRADQTIEFAMEDVNTHNINEQVTITDPYDVASIVGTVKLFQGIGQVGAKSKCQTIPFYNVQLPISMLKQFGALGILTVDASNFSKVGMEYGPDVYTKVKEVFDTILYSMWGKEGCFRDSDIICRKSATSNIYYIFMNRSRGVVPLPLPGALERVADRIGMMLQNELWAEMFAGRKRRIPECVSSLPVVGVGFCGIIHNPCLEANETIETGLEESRQVASSQLRRVRERQRELMQTLIQANDYLYPHFQAVFDLQTIDKESVDHAIKTSSIAPLSQSLYGFEALIRVNKDLVETELGEGNTVGIDPKYLRPDVLFSLAKSAKVSLELDQACLRQAELFSRALPGRLFVNILPRNLYHIERLRQVFSARSNVIFEVSESEDITNFELMLKSRDILHHHEMGIAADDFGKGYASLERVIRIKPNLIKFDRSMIQEIHRDPIKQAYVRGLVDAGKILGATILAEGVEKWEEAEVLKGMGVDYIQGFLLHKPQEVEKILEQLQAAIPDNRTAA